MSLLLKNCRIVLTRNSCEYSILQNVDIFINENRIEEIGKNLKEKTDEIIDCSNKLVMPGLINMHTHSPMILLRGYRDDQELYDWLNDVWAVERKLKPKDIYIGTLMACLEMIKTGTVCFVDMYFHMNEVARAVEETGIKAFLGYGMIDMWDKEKREFEIKETLRFIKSIKDKETIKPVVAPHGVYTCSKELLLEAKRISEEFNIPLTIHLSETRKEVYDTWKRYGKRPVEFLDEIKFLGKNVIAFHCSWVTKQEIKILARNDVTVVSCPTSNMKLATGGAFPYREFKEARANICLGTDGACSNNSLDMFREMKFFALMQKWFRWNGREITAQECLNLTTINPAKVLNLNSGSIEEGKVADIITLDLNHFSLLPVKNIISNLVYSTAGDCVSDIIINGELIIRDKKVLTVNEEKIKEKFEKTVEKLLD